MRNLGLVTLLSLSSLCAAACGDDTTANDDLAGRDLAAATGDMAKGADLATNPDMAGFLLVEDCQFGDYVDLSATGATRTITPWDTSLGKKCIIIAKGQSVTWQGVPNASHPLEPHGSGTTPNPITDVATTAFPSAGTYGFDCMIHHSLMHGAIWVR